MPFGADDAAVAALVLQVGSSLWNSKRQAKSQRDESRLLRAEQGRQSAEREQLGAQQAQTEAEALRSKKRLAAANSRSFRRRAGGSIFSEIDSNNTAPGATLG